MGRDDSSERPMLLRYCDSRRIVVPKGQSLVRIWGRERNPISKVRIGRRFLQVRGWADSRLTSMRYSDAVDSFEDYERMNQSRTDNKSQQDI